MRKAMWSATVYAWGFLYANTFWSAARNAAQVALVMLSSHTRRPWDATPLF